MTHRIGKDGRVWIGNEAATWPAPGQVRGEEHIVMTFAKAILHGDEEHQSWLLDAALCFIQGRPLPPPTSADPMSAPEFQGPRVPGDERFSEDIPAEDPGLPDPQGKAIDAAIESAVQSDRNRR